MRSLERAGLENKLPVWEDGRMIVNEGHIALRADDMLFATRKYRAPYGLEQVERRLEVKELDAAGPLHVAMTELRKRVQLHHHPYQWTPLGIKGVVP